jgi:hypothetical protein
MLAFVAGTWKRVKLPSMKGRAMQRLIYALRFTGWATLASADATMLRATATAPSLSLTSIMGPSGLSSALDALDGETATFESEVTFTGETSFQEIGSITFGGNHRLRFSTVGSGYLGPSVDPTHKHGTVMWRVEGGQGQFAKASGLITSNFVVGEDLAITDHHFGVLFVP